MFRTYTNRFSQLADQAVTGKETKKWLLRAAFFGGLLLLVWGVTMQIDGPEAEAEIPVQSPSNNVSLNAGAAEVQPPTDESAFPRTGLLISILVLGCGIALAVHLHTDQSEDASTPSIFAVLGRHSLAGSHELQLIRCGNEILLLSVSDERAELLKSYPREKIELPVPGLSSAEEPYVPPRSASGPFADLLRQYVSGVTN